MQRCWMVHVKSVYLSWIFCNGMCVFYVRLWQMCLVSLFARFCVWVTFLKKSITREDKMTDDHNSHDVAISIHSHIVLEYDQMTRFFHFLFVFNLHSLWPNQDLKYFYIISFMLLCLLEIWFLIYFLNAPFLYACIHYFYLWEPFLFFKRNISCSCLLQPLLVSVLCRLYCAVFIKRDLFSQQYG